MSKSLLGTVLSPKLIAKGLKANEESKSYLRDAKTHREEAYGSLLEGELREKKLRRNADEQKGDAVAKIGSSGVKVESFNDALFSQDIKTEQEAALIRYDTAQRVNKSMRQAKNEQTKRNAGRLGFFVDCMESLFPSKEQKN